ncbi:MAG: DegV family protein [Ruminococcus sp.]|uniref:DegV family protein n=1 Tax=Ruminococcus sp. TaxID=41978 RepID=UPI002873B0AB|nr:DegV family protein [Ruminococcus sp.]MBQ3285819.1 DegV family protein [Ruminococcus sp.]
MSNKVVITSDITCDLNWDLEHRYDVTTIPLHIVIGGKSYEDWVNITPEELYKIFYKTKELPHTTAGSVGEYTDFFKQFIDKGFDVVHLSLGSKLSVTHQSSVLASQEFPGRVFSIDTQNLSSGSGLLVIKACELRDEGLSAEEIYNKVSAMVPHAHASFVLDRLDFMHAGGRCSAVAMLGANLLSLKPSIEVHNDDGGSMGVGKKYRGKYDKVLIQYMEDTINKYENIDTDRVFVTHAGANQEYVDAVVEALKAKNLFKEVFVTRASCTISSHCGPNTLGVLFMTK